MYYNLRTLLMLRYLLVKVANKIKKKKTFYEIKKKMVQKYVIGHSE